MAARLAIQSIKVPKGRRAVNQQKVEELKDSIKKIGLIYPIVVDGDFKLIAGAHRLEAMKQLGEYEILCNVKFDLTNADKELIEIDENLIRNELHFTERSDLLLRRKQIYETLYPETKVGQFGNKGGQVLEKTESDFSKPSFVTDTSEKTGRSETVIKEELQIAKNLQPEEKQIIREADIPKTDALQLARMTQEERKPVIDLIAKGEIKRIREVKPEPEDPIDIAYDESAKEIEAKNKRVKKVMNLLDYTKHLGITEQHLREYFEMFPNNYDSFIWDIERLTSIIKEVKEMYWEVTKIRRIK
jgi:ParB family chromosome partitioning protein